MRKQLKNFKKNPHLSEVAAMLNLYAEKNPLVVKLMKKLDLYALDEFGTKITSEHLTIKNKENMSKTKHTTNANYNTIVNGKFAVWKSEPTEDSKPVVSKKTGVTRHYEMFKDITGTIVNIYLNEKELKGVDKPIEVLYVTIKDNSDSSLPVESIEMAFKGSYAQNFLKRLPSVDLTKPVTLVPYSVKDAVKTASKGKEIRNEGIKIIQDGETVPVYFTKENPNGLPALVEKKIKGKPSEWDNFDQLNFMRELVLGYRNELYQLTRGNVEHSEDESGDDLTF